MADGRSDSRQRTSTATSASASAPAAVRLAGMGWLAFSLSLFVAPRLAGGAEVAPPAPAAQQAAAGAVAESLAAGNAVDRQDAAGAAPALQDNSLRANGKGGGLGAASRRSGLFGLGLGLELPMVGVSAGAGSNNRPGAGYNLGAALAWESHPSLLWRIYGAGGRAYSGRASLSYEQAGRRVATAQDADWLSFEAGFGAAFLWRHAPLGLVPYAGGDVAAVYGGYKYHLDEEQQARLADPRSESLISPACRKEQRCSDDIYDAMALSWSVQARAGVRLPILTWLSTQAEVSASYLPIRSSPVKNTLTGLEAQAVAGDLVLARATFSVRLAL